MNEPQVLLEMPVLLVILLALVGGVFGEMWRADKDGASGWPLMRRLALRSGACMVCGVSTFMLLYSAGMSVLAAGALGCLTALAGADAAISLYQRWAAKRLGSTVRPLTRGSSRRTRLFGVGYDPDPRSGEDSGSDFSTCS